MFFFSWLRNRSRNPRSNRRRERPMRSHKLALERLEERCLLSAGDLDLSFGTNGVATNGRAGGPGSLAAIALAPDGKIVAGGSLDDAKLLQDFALCRFRSDGAIDSSFGAGGWVTTGFGTQSNDVATAVAVLPDGRVLAGGISEGDFALVRYTQAGAVDTTFGGKAKGLVVTDISSRSYDGAQAMVVQADGKIVLAGFTVPRNGSSTLALVRYNANGSLDTSFDGDGKLTVAASPERGVDVAVYPATAPGGLGGKLLVAAAPASSDMILTRFNADGSRDTSFGGGAGSVHVGNRWWNPDVAIQPDAKIVLSAKDQGATRVMLARFDTAGNLDAGFGTGGVSGTTLPNLAEPKSLALQPDGKMLVSATEYGTEPGEFNPVVLRYDTSGLPDATFGTNGKATPTATTFTSNVNDLALQPDGRILLGGSISTPGPVNSHRLDFVLLRLQGDAGLASPAPAPVSTSLLSSEEALGVLPGTPAPGRRTAQSVGLSWAELVDRVFAEPLAKKRR